MKPQTVTKETEFNSISEEAQHILDLLDKIEHHTIELRKKLVEELKKKNQS